MYFHQFHPQTKPLPFLQKFEARRKFQGINPSYKRTMREMFLSYFIVIFLTLFSILLENYEVNGVYIPPGPKFNCPLPLQIWPCRCVTSSDEGITLFCKDVSLATLSAALAFPVAYKIPVEYLNITKLNTQKLYGTIFNQLNSTKIRIENSPLREIYSDAFTTVKDTLKELEIIDTKLEEFPVEALLDLGNLESLIIDQHLISKLNKPITGLNSLKNLQVSNGNVTEFSKDTFASLGAKLNRLDLHGNSLKTVPKDAFQNLKNLEYLDVAFNQFDKLDPQYFFHLTKLTWFNGSHNAIPDFRRGAFARNGFLRVIYLSHNKLTKIEATAFRGMRLLVRLYLNDNQISDIGRAAFNSLARVRTIDLSRNRLKFVDFQMFMNLQSCEQIFLQENEITRIKSGAFNQLQSIHVNVSHNKISVIEKDAFVQCVNMFTLDMSHNLIDNFTKGAFDELSYAEEWKLEFNKLIRTQDIPLKFMSAIKILNVSHNELQEIGKNTFPKLYELHTVDFSYNNLSKIQGGILTNLFSLRALDLRHNSFTDLSGSAFGPLPTLLELHLDYNLLKTVSNALVSRLVSLREFTISNNKLKKIFQISGSLNDLNASNNEIESLSKAWPTMNSLQRLDLSGNNLGGNLVPGSFENLGALSQIRLARNNLSEIPVQALSDLRTVQYIDLSSNSLTILPRAALGRLPIVFTLLLSNNSIHSIEVKAFDGLLQLLHLDLSQNNLSSIPLGALTSLVSLRTLNLSRNAIERTENGTNCIFEDNLSLETLDLSSNKIERIYPQTFPELAWTKYKLANVNMSNNQIAIISREILRGTKTLRNLDLSHNRISEIRLKVLGNLTTLQSLDLSYNEIMKFEALTIGPPPELSKLKLDHNHLAKFPMDILTKAPLNFIDLQHNRIKFWDMDFLPKIKNGSRILMNENPIKCDCRMIFLQRYFTELRPDLTNFTQEYFQIYDDFTCKLEREGGFDLLKNLEESQLLCDSDEGDNPPIIPDNFDIELRSFTQKGTTVEVRWRVKSKMDVLGFKIIVLGEAGDEEVLQTKSFGYNVRAAGVALPKGAKSVCLVPNFSSKSGAFEKDFTNVKKICQNLDAGAVSSSYANAEGNRSSSTLKSSFLYFILIWNLIRV